ncbi:transcription initiation factor TFIID subunit 15 [Cryptomeria japonica]|uniref:transcription initiation factor TFIID subunit 15 n=1 Tax=Cryptomeria japonica TaxID=3369 RepID=UPI0025AC1E2F|nr:transcription initiation factor TFIID subunit 15 [Cryptomeria japonica]
MMGHMGAVVPSTASIYVCNLPPGTDETLLAEHFGTIGLLKKDKRTGRPKIWIYKDKISQEPKGDATVTYEDPHAAAAAVEWFNNTDFHGRIIGVFIAESKNKEPADQPLKLDVPHMTNAEEPQTEDSLGGLGDDTNDAWGGGGRGRGRGETAGKAWQQEGDWLCPNTSCGNVNFAFRGVCNRCGTARPAGSSGAGGMGGGRGRGRGNSESGRGRGVGGPPGLFGPNDWPCPMCGNVNWAKRTKCNVCNTSKPGHNEGGVRGGRAGGYKELDEAEIEETRRRRREAEEDDGEMYDEFGNLKKKFRAKMQQNETNQTVPGVGKAGWDDADLGVVEGREKNRDRGRDYHDRDRGRSRDGDGYNGHRYSGEGSDSYYVKDGSQDKKDSRYDYERGRSADRDHYGHRERERSRDRDRERDREKSRGKDRDRDRDRSRDYDRSRERDYDYDRDRDKDYSRERDRKSERSY